jgi:hypothetical protein
MVSLRTVHQRVAGSSGRADADRLPYHPGTNYTPDETENLWIENKGFIQTEVSLHWFRTQPGLIFYEGVCGA